MVLMDDEDNVIPYAVGTGISNHNHGRVNKNSYTSYRVLLILDGRYPVSEALPNRQKVENMPLRKERV